MLEGVRAINAGGTLISLEKPLVMGVLNLTPDSFYSNSRKVTLATAFETIEQMLAEGADIIDVGGCSSRPGIELATEEDEWCRLNEVLKHIKTRFPGIVVSLDTFRSEIVKRAFDLGSVDIVNDISSGEWDPELLDTVAEYNLAYILMHSKGKPNVMQDNPLYTNVTSEVIHVLSTKLDGLVKRGIGSVIIDPGFGFGKSIEHNYQLFNRLDDFKSFGLPLLVGISRKSMIYKPLKISPDESLTGTTALNMAALLKGAKILRVHDVREAVECVKLFELLNCNN